LDKELEEKIMLDPTLDQLMDAHLDVTNPQYPVEVKNENGVLWVNVGPVCLLRICQLNGIIFEAKGKVVHEDPKLYATDKFKLYPHQQKVLDLLKNTLSQSTFI
jgi:hypothetical protein